MKRTAGTFLACAFVLAFGADLHASPARSCMTEEIQRAVSPSRAMTALYENAVCSTDPQVIEARVLIIPGDGSSRDSWQTVYTATTQVDKQFRRPTQGSKLRLRWIDGATLAVETSPELSNGVQTVGELPLKLIVNQSNGQAVRSSPSASASGILEGLGSPDTGVVSEAIAGIYRKMGDESYWPVVNALWLSDKGAYPKFNWNALNLTVNRLRIAGLWGQWSRELRKDPGSAKVAANFARGYLTAKDEPVRLEAIDAIGALGTVEDREILGRIATENDKEAAIRATAAIFAIEQVTPVRESMLPFVSDHAQVEDVKALATRLLIVRRAPKS